MSRREPKSLRSKPLKRESEPATRRRDFVVLILLASVTFLVCLPARRYDFVNFDDPQYVTENPHVLTGLTWDNVVWAFSTTQAGFWHPVTWLSHMLDAQVFGNGPAAPHMINVVFHVANTLLVFAFLRKITGALWRSALVAALFGLHPLRVESVAWICERKDVLSAFFGLLTIWCYARYAMEPGKPNVRRGSVWYWLALLFFALGLMSKPMLVTLPFVLLLLDFWPLGRLSLAGFGASATGDRSVELNVQSAKPKTILVEKVPFLLLSAALCIITLLLKTHSGVVASLSELSLLERIENVAVAYGGYLEKTFWPAALANPYPLQAGWTPMRVAAGVALVAGICLIAVRFRRRSPFLIVGCFWFLGMLVPVSGVIQTGVQFMADRFTYLPSIGLFIAATWAAGDFLISQKVPKILAAIGATALLAACAVRSCDQLRYWQNTETLFRHTLAVTGTNAFADYNLGNYYFSHERIDDAIDCYTRSAQVVRFNAYNLDARNNLGVCLAAKGKMDEAIQQFVEVVRLAPNSAGPRNNLGRALLAKGRVEEAMAQFKQATEVDPQYTQAFINLGSVLASRGQVDEAIQQFVAALRNAPQNAALHESLGVLWEQKGMFDEAASQFEQSLQLVPTNPETHFHLGLLLARLGRREAAVAHLKEAVRLKPNFVEAQRQLQTLGAGGER